MSSVRPRSRPQSRTAVGPVIGELKRRFGEGRRALPPGAWQAWWRTVLAGAAGLLVLMWLMSRVARAALAAGRLDWEAGFLLRLGDVTGLSFASGVFIQTFGTDITLVILVTAASLLAVWLRRPLTALSIGLAPLVVDLVGRAGWAMWDRARPDVLWDGLASPGFHAFPSGHTSKTLAVYGFLAFLWIRASGSLVERAAALLLLAGIALVTPLGRMLIGVHWPSDVLAGYVLGAAWLALLAWALRFEKAGTRVDQ